MKILARSLIKTAGLAMLLNFGLAYAERPADLEPVPEPPPPPRGVQHGEAMPLGEPQITIRRRGEDIVREYRLNGHLFAVKITPKGGPPYYLIDADGDGDMESQFLDNNSESIIVPQWVIMRW